MSYWDIVNGRGFLPSIDPPAALYLGARWITVAHHVESVHSMLPRLAADGTAAERVGWVVRHMDLEGAIEDADETAVQRLAHLLEAFGHAAPGVCDHLREPLQRKLGYMPEPYYARCLDNWRRNRIGLIVHFQNIQHLTDFGGGTLVRMHVDMESRAVDALRAVATVFTKTSPEKMLRMVTQAVKGMQLPIDGIAGTKEGMNDGTLGRCLSLRALGLAVGGGADGSQLGLCEEHTKMFRRAEKVGEALRQKATGEVAKLRDEALAAWSETYRKYCLLDVNTIR